MTQAGQARQSTTVRPESVPYTAKFEMVVIPVSDVDRATAGRRVWLGGLPRRPRVVDSRDPGFAHWMYGDDREISPTKDNVLDNITLYWLTNTAASSARL